MKFISKGIHAMDLKRAFMIFVLIGFSLSLSCALAEERGSINGKVTDAATKEGLAGVNVIIKGTYYGASPVPLGQHYL
ncbi:MAG: hypothetical protein ACLP05_03610, partial [Candidatus Kryptoniota bacterium]